MSGRHALIVEDELISGLGMQAMLGPLGFHSFAFASTPKQAAEQARLRRPDLVTVDVALLDGDGLKAAQEIVAVCGPVPLIYVTGHPSALEHVPGAVVAPKPLGPGALAAACAAASRH